jgi:hypothetical protein
MEKIDDKARNMLKYLNSHTELSSATVAEIFNQHYKNDLVSSLETLNYLSLKELVKFKMQIARASWTLQVEWKGKVQVT